MKKGEDNSSKYEAEFGAQWNGWNVISTWVKAKSKR